MNQLKLFSKNHSRVVVGVVVLMVLQSFGTLLVPHFVANIIDYGILEKDRQAIFNLWRLDAADSIAYGSSFHFIQLLLCASGR